MSKPLHELDNWKERLFRRTRAIQYKAELMHDIEKHLVTGPDGVMSCLKHIEIKGPFPFGCEATLVFGADTRIDAARIMCHTLFAPQGLSMVRLQDGRKSMWPAFCKAGARNPVISKESLVPFTYIVAQHLKRPPTHTVRWFCTLGETRVVCEADVAHDEARFNLEHYDDVAHNAVVWRWNMNEYFPEGVRRGYGHRWDAIKGGENGARTETYWPFKSLPDNYANFNISYATNLLRISLVCLYGPEKAEGMLSYEST